MGEQVSWKDTLLAESCWLASEHRPLRPLGNTQHVLSTVIPPNDNKQCQSADYLGRSQSFISACSQFMPQQGVAHL